MDMNQTMLDIFFILVCAILIFFMQAGFAMLETGLTRAKNAANIMTKNIMDFSVGVIVYFAIGYAFMFGKDVNGILGISGFFDPASINSSLQGGLPSYIFIFFQAMFCATAATIVSGAMAGRTRFSSYLICSAMMSMLIFPITGHWIWGGGWLSDMGYHDLAGGSAVHMVGGICAFVGAFLVGARKGKYGKRGESYGILGHNLPLAGLGTFILWFGWFGFNCGSLLGVSEKIAIVAVNTGLAAAAGAVGAMCFTWIRFKKPDVSMIFNGAVAGLVSITAGADVVYTWEAVLMGALGGILMCFSVAFIDRKLRVDDPVGAISVHGVCGLWGIVATGIFGENCDFGVQLVGVLAVVVYVFIAAFIFFGLVKKLVGLRVSEKTEVEGLDNHEHNADAYANFRYHNDR